MSDEKDNCVRLRGLPWTATVDDIASFLSGCHISSGPEAGIHITRNIDGRPSGEAFVELESSDDVKLAISKNKEHIGKRYIDVFKIRRNEFDWVFKHSAINHEGSLANDCIVRLRGLPFGCSKEEIANFFTGLEIVPNGITILSDQLGRTTGGAFVQFARPELVDSALLKHKELIGHRYVEIFRSNSEELMGSVARMCRQRGGGVGGGVIGRGDMSRSYGYVGMYENQTARGMGMGGPRMGPMGGPFMGDMMGGTYPGRGGRYGGRGFPDDGNDRFGRSRGAYMNGRFGYGDGDHLNGGYGLLRGSGGYAGGSGPRSGALVGRRGMRGGMPMGMGDRRVGGYSDYNRGERFEKSQTGHSIHMRGLPYSATEDDIAQFFSPISLVSILVEYNSDGRPSGDADVDFATHEDSLEAMKRHKANMNNRYIELFLHSSPVSGGGYCSFKNQYGNGSTYGALGRNYTPF